MTNTWDLPTEGCESQIIAPDVPCATHNVCVLGIDNRIYRIVQELIKNQSSRVTAMSQDDKTRIDQFYDELLEYINVTGDSLSDFHYLIQLALTDLLEIVINTENETVNSALHYLVGADINLRVCQSTRLNDGLLAQDKNDLVNAINKSKSVIDGMFQAFNPIDMPQSNPRVPVVQPTKV